MADVFSPVVRVLMGAPAPVRIEFWDGSSLGPDASANAVRLRSPDAWRRMLWAPGELGIARAYVSGDVELVGDIFAVLRDLRTSAVAGSRAGMRAMKELVVAALRLGMFGRPPSPPVEEVRQVGRLHSRTRDRRAIEHHYDIGNEFFELVLGESMTYTCARFPHDTSTLEEAQAAKHELICRKLGLDGRPGLRLLDVGCGWGALAMHAASRHGTHVTAVTISESQATWARQHVKERGLDDRVDIRLQDYRDIRGETFDAISSIGMSEGVGKRNIRRYVDHLGSLLARDGRLLNHAISKPGGSRPRGRSFVHRYVFPDGELLDVADVILAMQRTGLEVLDVESLRTHYARTLRRWVANLQLHYERAVELVGSRRARVWLLYMAASANKFDEGPLNIHQVLGAFPRNDVDGFEADGFGVGQRRWAIDTGGDRDQPR